MPLAAAAARLGSLECTYTIARAARAGLRGDALPAQREGGAEPVKRPGTA
jgi:hypothetical protein